MAEENKAQWFDVDGECEVDETLTGSYTFRETSIEWFKCDYGSGDPAAFVKLDFLPHLLKIKYKRYLDITEQLGVDE